MATYVPARNMVFLSVAASYADALEISDLFIGVSETDFIKLGVAKAVAKAMGATYYSLRSLSQEHVGRKSNGTDHGLPSGQVSGRRQPSGVCRKLQ